jgi:predicted GIY-YIG superfamily endonuclease
MVNYIKTIMYKIVCKDLTVKAGYVGGTTDFTSRKKEH